MAKVPAGSTGIAATGHQAVAPGPNKSQGWEEMSRIEPSGSTNKDCCAPGTWPGRGGSETSSHLRALSVVITRGYSPEALMAASTPTTKASMGDTATMFADQQ